MIQPIDPDPVMPNNFNPVPPQPGPAMVARAATTLEAGRVLRYHAVPSVGSQNIAHHSWGVAVICLYLTGGKASSELLVEALMHDTAELFTGDIPFTVKRDRPDIKDTFDLMEDDAREAELLIPPQHLSDRDHALLKLADTLEGFVWCRKTELRGPVLGRWTEAFAKARCKFSTILTVEEITLATTLFQEFGGILCKS